MSMITGTALIYTLQPAIRYITGAQVRTTGILSIIIIGEVGMPGATFLIGTGTIADIITVTTIIMTIGAITGGTTTTCTIIRTMIMEDTAADVRTVTSLTTVHWPAVAAETTIMFQPMSLQGAMVIIRAVTQERAGLI